MKTSFYPVVFGGMLLATSPASADVVRHPVNAGVALEEYQLYSQTSNLAVDYAPVFMVRPIGWIFGSATVDERIDLVFGLGATIFSVVHNSGSHPAGYESDVYPAVSM